jgi:hypothetical protein
MNATPRKSTFTGRRGKNAGLHPLEVASPRDSSAAKAALKVVRENLQGSSGTNPRGRPKGSKDKIPRELRAAVLDAGHLAGFDVVVRDMTEQQIEVLQEEHPDLNITTAMRRNIEKAVRKVAQGDMTDYLRYQAEHNPGAFMTVLGKVLPKQIDMNVQLTSRQVLDEMQERRDRLAELRGSVIDAARGVDYHAEDGG